MEIKIKWIKRKQMTHENTYRDDTIIIINLILLLHFSTLTRLDRNLTGVEKPAVKRNNEFLFSCVGSYIYIYI